MLMSQQQCLFQFCLINLNPIHLYFHVAVEIGEIRLQPSLLRILCHLLAAASQIQNWMSTWYEMLLFVWPILKCRSAQPNKAMKGGLKHVLHFALGPLIRLSGTAYPSCILTWQGMICNAMNMTI